MGNTNRLNEFFVFKIGLGDNILYIGTHALAGFLVQILHINRLTVFNDYGGLFYFRKMVFEYRSRVHDRHGNDGNACLLRNLKAAFMEGEEGILCLIPGALRKIQMETPFLAFSMACRIVLSPALISWRSRKRQCRSFIQIFNRGHFSISFWQRSR